MIFISLIFLFPIFKRRRSVLSNITIITQICQQIIINDDHIDKFPHVFLINDINDESMIMNIIHKFTLNEIQCVFHIIAYHILERNKIGSQLHLRIFGEDGTGKSHLIIVIRA